MKHLQGPARGLLDFADGRANPDAVRRVEAHLAGCAACRTTAERLGAPPVLRVEVPRRSGRDARGLPTAWTRWIRPVVAPVAVLGQPDDPKPVAWAAAAALLVLYVGNHAAAPARHAPASAPPATSAPARPVLLDRVDRLTLSDGTGAELNFVKQSVRSPLAEKAEEQAEANARLIRACAVPEISGRPRVTRGAEPIALLAFLCVLCLLWFSA